jgi:hypothetical protein
MSEEQKIDSEEKAVAAVDAMFAPPEPVVEGAEAVVPETTTDSKQEAAPEAKATETVQEVGSAPAPEAPDYLDPEKLSGKKVKVKIGGVESEVTFDDLRKSYQLEGYLTQKAQKLAEEKRQLEELKRSQISAPPARADAPVSPQNEQVSNDPMATLRAEIRQEILAEIDPIRRAIEPVAIQEERKRVAAELKSEGFADGDTFANRIESYLGTLTDKPEIFEREAMAANTPEGAKALFYRLKALERTQAPANVATTPNKIAERPRAPVVKIDSGSSAVSVTDDWSTKYSQLLKEAQKTGDPDAWTRVLAHKGAL